MNNYCVLTTINKPTHAVKDLHDKFGENLIVVGDKKTPEDWEYKNALYLPGNVGTNQYAPFNHYARKNWGYMHAIAKGADLIYDTDDDNCPNENWKIREAKTPVSHTSNQEWCNIYQPLTEEYIWPRGFPLSRIREKTEIQELDDIKVCPIQQGLSDVSPDVDAIWRLLNKQVIFFSTKKSIWLINSWCTFNSQVTWWFPEAYPLLYLPSTVSFRMTDIFRSMVAQRCLWELGYGVVFHSPSEVIQFRNPHDLMKDFLHEVMGYLKIEIISDALKKLKLGRDIFKNIELCYTELLKIRVVGKKEMPILKNWINDVKNVKRIL